MSSPAQLAGVGSIAVAAPPQRENAEGFAGYPNVTILATCALLGSTRWPSAAHRPWRCSPHGVADLLRAGGPGHRAGQCLCHGGQAAAPGVVGIDAEAGPTEIAVLADDSADPEHVAADLLSQAEHDPLAAAVLVTDSQELADAVEAAVRRRVAEASTASGCSGRCPAHRAGSSWSTTSTPGSTSSTPTPPNTSRSRPATPTRSPSGSATRARSSLGVRPGEPGRLRRGVQPRPASTAGTAAHASGLSVQSFLRGIHVVRYDRAALAEVAPHVVAPRPGRGPPGHGEAVTARFGGSLP